MLRQCRKQINNLHSFCIHCIKRSIRCHRTWKKDSICQCYRSWGSVIARISWGPDNLAGISIQSHPSTGCCRLVGRCKAERHPLAIPDVCLRSLLPKSLLPLFFLLLPATYSTLNKQTVLFICKIC